MQGEEGGHDTKKCVSLIIKQSNIIGTAREWLQEMKRRTIAQEGQRDTAGLLSNKQPVRKKKHAEIVAITPLTQIYQGK
jgi:hypothetical protein